MWDNPFFTCPAEPASQNCGSLLLRRRGSLHVSRHSLKRKAGLGVTHGKCTAQARQSLHTEEFTEKL